MLLYLQRTFRSGGGAPRLEPFAMDRTFSERCEYRQKKRPDGGGVRGGRTEDGLGGGDPITTRMGALIPRNHECSKFNSTLRSQNSPQQKELRIVNKRRPPRRQFLEFRTEPRIMLPDNAIQDTQVLQFLRPPEFSNS